MIIDDCDLAPTRVEENYELCFVCTNFFLYEKKNGDELVSFEFEVAVIIYDDEEEAED